MHEAPKRCMQVAGFWKVPKILNFYAFSEAFDGGSTHRKNPAMTGLDSAIHVAEHPFGK
jgi:hypothetical protein